MFVAYRRWLSPQKWNLWIWMADCISVEWEVKETLSVWVGVLGRSEVIRILKVISVMTAHWRHCKHSRQSSLEHSLDKSKVCPIVFISESKTIIIAKAHMSTLGHQEKVQLFSMCSKKVGFPSGSVLKNSPASAGRFSPWLRKIPCKSWEIPRAEEPDGLQCLGSQRVTT